MSELDDIDGLAAEYVLGTLTREERQVVADRRVIDKELDLAIEAWERRLAPLVETISPVAPSPNLYNKIRTQIGPSQQVVSLKAREQMLARRAARWRNAFVGATAVAASLVGVLGYRETVGRDEARQYVAVLDSGDDLPAFLLTVDTRTKMCVITAVNPPTQSAKTYQVWMVSDKMPKPKSLGMVNKPGEMQMMPMQSRSEMDLLMNASFAVSVEPMGGSPTGAPSGPVMFTGKLVQATP
jgi:anti-sigma-K factor RskA